MEVAPEKQNLDAVFSKTAYCIDFYQRDYRWTDEPVLRLLDDVFHKFNDHYERSTDLDPGKEAISTYPWYYLSTYVTNEVEGQVYVVDGQQRLTTMSLVLIKLRHLAKGYDSKLAAWIDSRIAGQSGYEKEFWMNHVGHRSAQNALFDGQALDKIDVSSGITARNMVRNYATISDCLDKQLGDKRRFEMFVFYFLTRLVLINLSVEQTDVSMVFEVINDRGVRLRPYEILKGKLLGQIHKLELDKGGYNELWERQAGEVNSFAEDEMDGFLRTLLKAKFAGTRKDGQRFDGDYHRAMFAPDMDDKLGLLHNPARVKSFLKGEFLYYSKLYVKIRKAYEHGGEKFRPLYFSNLLELTAPLHLVLSSCALADPVEDEKITRVATEVDRFYALLQLQNAYDSNEFADAVFRLSESIREKEVSAIRPAFDAELKQMIADRRNVADAEPLSYSAFRQTGINLNLRFKRYFFARIDEFLAANMNLNPKHTLADLVTKTGSKTGFHIEHILSWNEENRGLFGADEEVFEQERNRLGGILLLKGKDNISSGNETYSEKLKSYANTLYWNETLRSDSYKSKLDLAALKERHGLDLVPLAQFGPEELEARHRLLFKLVSIIWG